MQTEIAENVKQYLLLLKQWMGYFGFTPLGVETNWLFDVSYKRDRVEASKFSKVSTYCFVKYANEMFDKQKFENFSKSCFDYASKIRQGMPVGLGGSLVVYPCLIVNGVSKELKDYISIYLNKHYSAFEFPAILDISDGNLYYYQKTPMWGAFYYNGFRKEIFDLYSPTAWNKIAGK